MDHVHEPKNIFDAKGKQDQSEINNHSMNNKSINNQPIINQSVID